MTSDRDSKTPGTLVGAPFPGLLPLGALSARGARTVALLGFFLAAAAIQVEADQVSGTRGTWGNRSMISLQGLSLQEQDQAAFSGATRVLEPPFPLSQLGVGDGGGGSGEPVSGPVPAGLPDEGGGTGGGAPSNFPALGENGTEASPDTHGAVGLQHLVTMLNTGIRIQHRDGTILGTVSLANFWSGVGAVQPFHPKVVYDPLAKRYIATALSDARSPRSSLLIAVSQTSDPSKYWYTFRIDADAQDQGWAEYPNIGFNKDWIVVSVNMASISGAGFRGVHMYVFDKAKLYANAPAAGEHTLLKDTESGFNIVPAVTLDPNASELHLLEVDQLLANYAGSSSRLRLGRITGALGSERYDRATAFTANTNSWRSAEPGMATGGSAPQLGTSRRVMNNDSRIQNVVFRHGSLWATHTVFLNAGGINRSAIQWWQLNPDGNATQRGLVDDPAGIAFYAFPSIAVNKRNDVMIGYTRFSSGQYASANYSYRLNSDAPGTLRSDTIYKAGEGPYVRDGGTGGNRWGDYSATVVDPANDVDMWTVQEYASAPASTWGTWWGRLGVLAAPLTRIEFTIDTVLVPENGGQAVITVANPGGAAGTVEWTTVQGTAVAGTDFESRTDTLTFDPGQTEGIISIPVMDNFELHANRTFSVVLSNPTGGAALGFLNTIVVEISDDETVADRFNAGEFNFSSYLDFLNYSVTENEVFPYPCPDTAVFAPYRSVSGALITVVRTNAAVGRVRVDYATVEGGTAVEGQHYSPVFGTLYFDNWQMSTNFVIPVNYVEEDVTVRIQLSNPVAVDEEEMQRPGLLQPRLGLGSETTLFIRSINSGLCSRTTNSMGTVSNVCVPTFALERRYYGSDEYPSATTPGGTKQIFVDVINPGFPMRAVGDVNFIVPAFPNLVGIGIFSAGVLSAGSDFAEAVGTNGFRILPNPFYTDPQLRTITNYWDYQPMTVRLTFGQDECRERVILIITNDSTVEFNEDIIVRLERIPSQPIVHPNASRANITILFDDEPAGAADREWNPQNVAGSDPPFNITPGANNTVSALAVQADGKTLLGGEFTAVNARSRNRIARFDLDGSLDLTFIPGTGADRFVSSIAVYPFTSINAGRILIAGGFTSYNGTLRNSIARLFPDGSLDSSFNPGAGANAPIRSIVLQPDGRILVAGEFTEIDGVPRVKVARLNPDGLLDLTFDPGFGAEGNVLAVALLPDFTGEGGRVLVGGDFLFFDGVFNGRLAMLDSSGNLDPSFTLGSGADGTVYSVAVQTDGMIVVAGDFETINDQRAVSIARLTPTGALDPNFSSGSGANAPIYALTLQPDNKALIGGLFETYNGTRRLGLARLRLNGTLDTSFLDTAYNQFAGLINDFSFSPPKFVRAIALQQDGDVMIGGSFTNIGGNPSAQAAERNTYTKFTRSDKVLRYNVARLIGGVTPGPGNADFESAQYFVDENGTTASVQLRRTDGRLGSLVGEAIATDRVATNGVDFAATRFRNTWLSWNFANAPISVGQVSAVYYRIPIVDDMLREGDEILDLSLLKADGNIILGGVYIPLGGALGFDRAQLTIADNDFTPGVFNFSTPRYLTNENATFVIVTVIRTNGTAGPASVDYFTAPALTSNATPNQDYRPMSGTLNFGPDQSSLSFTIRLLDDILVENDENIGIILTNATGGAQLPGGSPIAFVTAVATIVDNDFPPGRVNFSVDAFQTNENNGDIVIAVERTGGNVGAVSVSFQTQNVDASAPLDYLGTNGLLFWDDGQSGVRTFRVPLINDDSVEGAETFRVILGDPSLAGLLGDRTNVLVTIEDADSPGALSFNQAFYQADENSSVVNIQVVRIGGIAGSVSANYATVDTGGAVPGQDYTPTSGTLTLGPGVTSTNFQVLLLDDVPPGSQGNRCLRLSLSNPTNAVLGLLTNVVLTIVDNETFSIPPGRFDSTFVMNAQANDSIHALALEPIRSAITNCVQTFIESSNKVFIAGDFTSVNNATRIRIARLHDDGSLDTSFDPALGPNDSVRALAFQPDNKIIIGGFFSQYQATNRNGIARLNTDGSLDGFFNPGAGADNPVYALVLQPDLRVIVGGGFSSFNGITRPGIVRLTTNGTVDVTFNPGSGANGNVFAVAIQDDGKIVIGGDFTVVGGAPRGRIARLNNDGSLDTSFNPLLGFNAAVRALLIQPDGKIVAGGSFTTFGADTRNYLARLNANGSLDTGFLAAPLTGADSAVYALDQQIDGRLVVAGDFRRFNGVTRNRLTRLYAESSATNPAILAGGNDPTINFGNGADSFIATVRVQPDRKIIFGGGFTSYDDVARNRIARIHGGSVSGGGGLEFIQSPFLVTEDGSNAVVVVRRRGGTAGQVAVNYRTTTGTAVDGVNYTAVTGTLVFPEGETRQSFVVPILDNAASNPDLFVDLELVPGTFTNGATNGPQPTARLVILNDETTFGFIIANFSANENVAGGNATIVVTRFGGTNRSASVTLATTIGGSAIPGSDFLSSTGIISFVPGQIVRSFPIPIINDTNIEGNETVQLILSGASGANTINLGLATLTIVDDDFGVGAFSFSAAVYNIAEGNTNARITIVRTNGSTGVASVRVATIDDTAVSGFDYAPTNLVLSFADGESLKTFEVRILDDIEVEPLESLRLLLSSATGGARITTLSNAVLTISDTDTNLIVAAGSTLTFENIFPPNQVIDPGETVTLQLGLRNLGTVAPANLRATLLTGNGVSAPSGQQVYGSLVPNGPAVTRPFTFTAQGTNGSRLLVTLLLTDNGQTNGFVTFPFTLSGEARTAFTNSGPITIVDNSPASPYPSIINVANIGGTLTRVTVTLHGLSHNYPDDVDVLLVSPSGEKVMLMSDVGGGNALNNVTLTFDASATASLPDATQIVSGAYLPTNPVNTNTSDFFPPPAPGLPYTNVDLASLNGQEPNGTWRLYVIDDSARDNGFITNGWSLTIQSEDPVVPAADLSLAAGTGAGGIGGGPILVGNEFRSVVTVTNYGTAMATNVVVSEAMPAGLSFVSATVTKGAYSRTGNSFVWNVGNLSPGSGAILTMTASASAAGSYQTSVTASSVDEDLNPIDNIISFTTTVNEPTEMAFSRQGNSLTISWPASAAGTVVEASESLANPNWQPVNIAPTSFNGRLSITITPGTAQRFFRLSQ